MARVGGNPGNKGGGRKPVKKEREELLWILKNWTDENAVEKLKKKKRLSLREIYLLKAISGSESVLNKIADKILPDKLDFTSDGESFTNMLTPEEIKAYAAIRLGLLSGTVPGSQPETSPDLGNGQPNSK